MRQGIALFRECFVQISEIYVHSSFFICLLYKNHIHQSVQVHHLPDKSGLDLLSASLMMDGLLLLWGEALLLLHWAVGWIDI